MRIFWLGMHKLLVKTELARLRSMGYEVFNPKYLSHIPDQSADLNWNAQQPSSLPPAVFKKLSEYNFFYNSINSEIGHLLNQYFDAVIVTIHPDWLHEILKVYKKKVIFRTYGQTQTLSGNLFKSEAYRLICEHPDFYFSPHAEEAVETEDTWLREKAIAIPYCLEGDIFNFQDHYQITGQKSGTIAVSCPNIDSNHYYSHFKYLKKNLPDCYKMYGYQLRKVNDSQIVGTIPRGEFIQAFLHANAYLYTYTDARVCYLPPIEMMFLGGPVVFLQGSLLDRYFKKGHAPGRADSIEHAKELCNRLLVGDHELAEAIIASQKAVRKRYHPDFVWPIFEQKMHEMLNSKPISLVSPVLNTIKPQNLNSKQTVFLYHHFPGECVKGIDGQYSAHDGIPRVTRLIVQALLESGKYAVKVTCRKDQAQNFYGFFKKNLSDDLQVVCIDDVVNMDFSIFNTGKRVLRWIRKTNKFRKALPDTGIRSEIPPSPQQMLAVPFSRVEKLITKFVFSNRIGSLRIIAWFFVIAGPVYMTLRAAKSKLRKGLSAIKKLLLNYLDFTEEILIKFEKNLGPFLLTRFINKNYPNSICLIPHYYLFPECLYLKTKTIMYIPDYSPHFFEETGEFGLHLRPSAVGQNLVKKTSAVLTNSNYSKSYLPSTRLQVPKNKIKMFYLPNLNTENEALAVSSDEIISLKSKLGGSPFIFYPTQPRENKNLDLLARIFKELLTEKPELKLVLTFQLTKDMKLYAEFGRLQLIDKTLFCPDVADSTLSWLYQNCLALIFTSLMEGNFPPQIFEALYHRVPVVATRLPLIVERLGGLTNKMLLCNPNSLPEFLAATKKCFAKRSEVLAMQEPVRSLILEQGSWENFSEGVIDLFEGVTNEK